MPALLLVRHGQASFGAEDYDVLSPLGEQQSRLVGAAVSSRGLRSPLVVSGTLRRQRSTAEAAGLAEPVVDGRWDEYDHLALLQRYPSGDESDGSSRSVQALLDASLAAWIADAEGGFDDFRDGAVAALAALPADRDAVVVTSGGVVAAVCSALLGLGAPGFVALNRVAVNAAITTVLVGRSGTSLLTFNEHSHLPRELVTYR
jgi:broad specificity phosphatase PhoE